MANANLQPMRYSYSQGLYSTAVDNSQLEDTAQTFYDGALVVMVAGYVQECGANPTRIDGVAIGPALNLTAHGPSHMFTLPNDDMIYEISVDKASAQGGAGAILTQAQIGTTFGVTKDTLGSSAAGTPLYWYLDVDKSAANQRVLLIGVPVFSPLGTVNGRAYVKFLQGQVLQ